MLNSTSGCSRAARWPLLLANQDGPQLPTATDNR